MRRRRVAWPRTHRQAARRAGRRGRALDQFCDQARLAQARLARQQQHAAFVGSTRQGPAFCVAADQSGRALQGRGHDGHGPQRRVGGRALDGGQQRQRVGRRAGPDFVLQHLFTTVEGQQRRGPVAQQIVQPHQAPVRRLRLRLQRQQLLRVHQRIARVARALGHVRQLDQRAAPAALPPFALLRQPGAEFGAVVVRCLSQHGVGVVQVVRDAGGERQRGLADDQLRAHRLAQLMQPLSQRVACGLGGAVRPQQGRQLVARRRPLQAQPGQ